MIVFALSSTMKAGAISYLPGYLLLITFQMGLLSVPLFVLMLFGFNYLVAIPFL